MSFFERHKAQAIASGCNCDHLAAPDTCAYCVESDDDPDAPTEPATADDGSGGNGNRLIVATDDAVVMTDGGVDVGRTEHRFVICPDCESDVEYPSQSDVICPDCGFEGCHVINERPGETQHVLYRFGSEHQLEGVVGCEVYSETDGDVEDETDSFDAYEEKLDELNAGLLEAYAAGFSQAMETFEIDAGFDTDIKSLRENEAIAESHYYYWDGRTRPLQFWLRDQFDLESNGGDGRNAAEADFFPTNCVLCGFEGETHEEYEQHMEECHD